MNSAAYFGDSASGTRVQKMAQWSQMLALERHHESNLPCQRYKHTRSQPAARNPIAPAALEPELMAAQMDRFLATINDGGFDALNGPRNQVPPRTVGNPLFGYSTYASHYTSAELAARKAAPAPAAAATPAAPSPAADAASSAAASRAKMEELKAQIAAEREKRAELEEMLKNSPRR